MRCVPRKVPEDRIEFSRIDRNLDIRNDSLRGENRLRKDKRPDTLGNRRGIV